MAARRLGLLAGLLLAAAGFFLFWGLEGRVGFILELRATKLAGLLLVGASLGLATVVFQTVSANRVLTPAIMGFDALFVMLQALLVFLLGGAGFGLLPLPVRFLLESAAMMGLATLLFALLLRRGRQDLQRLILVGVVLGILFRAAAGLFARLADPAEFAVLQGAMFASFGAIDGTALAAAAVAALPCFLALARLTGALDVLALGRGAAVSLGLEHDRLVLLLIALVAVLVSASTALVGPITFLGLLVAGLAHALMRTHRHALLLPAAALIAALVLVVGQGLFERVLGLRSTLSVIVEGAGGLFFLALVLRGRVR